ncbi:polysaccharide deacetylase family protein [Amycolatopsis alkalitolerans]|uniref:Polysaccharide deacetylase n=1 Tax=Amycolatopsis alkalitolerans TaxID=2547244 RepID=A0A5C4M8M5_9PSEU|nr:polysaccharide deacetylase family protein [Amycolatopsis alkalitolerans]TNC29456.1 polysaccharide deacetylase [Amycolatopsis alkalitolerans]
MEHELYPYSPIASRPPLSFPNGARLAFYAGLNIEHFRIGTPFPGTAGTVPDPMSYGWRDYGNRVGIWRLMDLFDDVGIRATGIINSEVCTEYPEIIKAGVERNWAWVAHGKTNSIFQAGMAPDEEEQFLAEMFATLDASLPARPRGWLGPGLNETFTTPRLLAEAGLTYLLDWCCDDQPFPLNIPGMLSVPYGIDVNDYVLFTSNPALTGPDYERIVLDQFEQLLDDSATTGRVLALPLHTFIVGQPFRAKYLARVLRAITSTPEVWVCTGDDIAEHYASIGPEQAT